MSQGIILDEKVQKAVKKSDNDIVAEQAAIANFKYEAEKEQQAVLDDFKEWIEKPFPKFLDQHEIKGHEVIILVYGFKPKAVKGKSLLLNAEGTKTSEDLKHRTFSIAKVLKAGADSGYTAGQFVKLYDFQVASIENPEYSLWNHNEYSKSNLKQIGQEPDRFMNNIGRFFGPKMVVLNPLKTKLEEDDFLTFKVTPADIANPIKDVHAFLG